MTEQQRTAWTADLADARDRAARARHYGDHAGELIASADARAIADRIRRGADEAQRARSAGR